MTAFLLILVLGISTTFWALVGLGRVLDARFRSPRPALRPSLQGPNNGADRHGRPGAASSSFGSRDRLQRDGVDWVQPSDVAILVAAHNEELVIDQTISAASALVDVANVHVISDGSKDSTAAVARGAGANVLELNPNRGKAGALAAGIEHFELCRRYKVVLLLDADTHLAPDYLSTGLPLFNDPEVVAVAGRAKTLDDMAPPTRFGRFLVAYRERLYLIVQLLMKFGQATRWANAVTIVPGFASMYRTDALQHIDVVGAGLVIEDFNMTFEIHAKKLGRLEFHPSAATAYTQDPDTFRDYKSQVRRWILGFWQTVRRHRIQPSVFGVTLLVFIVELVTSSMMFVLLIPVLTVSMLASVLAGVIPDPAAWVLWVGDLLQPQSVVVGVLIPDYLLTIMAALILRRPRYLLLGLAFPLMRIVDAALCLKVLPKAFAGSSSGVWVSPTRRAIAPAGGIPAARNRSGAEQLVSAPSTGASPTG